MSNFIPTGSQALRHFADTLDQQAVRLDRLLWRDHGQRSTTAEAYQSREPRFSTIIMTIGWISLQTCGEPLNLPLLSFCPLSLPQGAI